METGKNLVYPPDHAFAGQPLFMRRFIPSKLSDNPYLAKDGIYEANLLSLPENQRRQLLDGDWSVSDGAAFSEFRLKDHTIKPFDIPLEIDIRPPAPSLPLPLTILKLPLAPLEIDRPVEIAMEPLLPDVDTPLFNTSDPLVPDVPDMDVFILKLPLDVKIPSPDVKEIEPPVDAVLWPDSSTN